MCQLFDAFVGSILNYSTETWGFRKSKAIERIHLKFCKRILQVRTRTSTVAVHGELGRFPMYILRYHKIIKYWFKVLQTENIILKNVNLKSLHDVKCGKRKWVFNVKRILDIYGFSDVFNNPASYNPVPILSLLKEKMVDCFKQEWFSYIRESS